MRRDAHAVRGERPTVLISLREQPDAGPVLDWVRGRLTSAARR
jgi:urease accessory protein